MTESDKDNDGIFHEEKLEMLRNEGYSPLLPPELKAQTTVICSRLDELVWEN